MKLVVKTEDNKIIPSSLEESNIVTSVNGQEGEVVLTHLELGAEPLGASKEVEDKLMSSLDYLDNNKLDKVDYIQHFRGLFNSIASLNSAIPVGIDGDYAHIDEGVGFDRACAIWDSDDSQWILTGSSVVSNTDEVAEGSSNLYFKSERVRNTTLTGLSLTNNAEINSLDSILTSLGKLQAQVSKTTPKWYKASEIGTLHTDVADSFITSGETIYWEFAKINGMLWTRGGFKTTRSIPADTSMLVLTDGWKIKAIRTGSLNNTTTTNNILNIDSPVSEGVISIYSIGVALTTPTATQQLRNKNVVGIGNWGIFSNGGMLNLICLGSLIA